MIWFNWLGAAGVGLATGAQMISMQTLGPPLFYLFFPSKCKTQIGKPRLCEWMSETATIFFLGFSCAWKMILPNYFLSPRVFTWLATVGIGGVFFCICKLNHTPHDVFLQARINFFFVKDAFRLFFLAYALCSCESLSKRTHEKWSMRETERPCHRRSPSSRDDFGRYISWRYFRRTGS